MTREEILTSMFDAQGTALEIGPSYNPLLPKATYPNVETLDYSSKASLIQRYADVPGMDLSRIEEPTYISDGRSMVDVIGTTAKYDAIIASHVIEHTPDMIAFLNECETLLRPGGVLVLAVPDKRFCFDFFRPLSSSGEVIRAHNEKRRAHTPEVYFDFFINSCKRGGVIGWDESHPGDLEFRYSEAEALREYRNAFAPAEYVDTHAWVYTPSSFRLIMHDLSIVQATRLKEKEFHLTQGLEFFISLSTAGAGSPCSRLQLAEQIEKELAFVETQTLRREIEALRADNAQILRSRRLTSLLRTIRDLISSH